MKKIAYGVLALCSAFATFGAVGCKRKGGGGTVITVWVSEADRAFASQVADDFKSLHPDKDYRIVIDIQGENDIATRILNDVENAADVFSCPNDQLPKLINGDALARIAGERLERVRAANDERSMDSATVTINGQEGVYGMPYTDNTFFLYYNKAVLTETDIKSIDGILSKCSANRQFAFPMRSDSCRYLPRCSFSSCCRYY